jgi:hypothetical protein
MSGRRVRFWFLAGGTSVSVLCIPVGIIAGKVEMSGTTCKPQDLCFSMQQVYRADGVFGLVTCFALVALALAIESVVALVRRT